MPGTKGEIRRIGREEGEARKRAVLGTESSYEEYIAKAYAGDGSIWLVYGRRTCGVGLESKSIGLS